MFRTFWKNIAARVPTCLLMWVCAAGLFPTATANSAPTETQALAARAKSILETNCFRCHGQNGANEGGLGGILDFATLKKSNTLVAGSSEKSRIFKRAGINRDMPPEEEKQRPSEEEIAILKKWIDAGAPEPVAEETPARRFLSLLHEVESMRNYLRKQSRESRAYTRFFTLRHLHNMPSDKVRDADLRLYAAALSKLVNSLSWKPQVVIPLAVDAEQTIFAVDIRRLDWDRRNLWHEILKVYPYGLKHDRYPDDPALNDTASEVYDLAGTDIPILRADWFIATAARPPLYHTLLQIPRHAGELERLLRVDVSENFRRDQMARAGFNGSGVSGHNRLVERHDSAYGAYWKSYDFKSSAGSGNLFVFPLGPAFAGHPYPRQVFKHDGGEIIFNLPNGLQAYMLVDGKDNRIDSGPIEVVSDGKRISGTPAIVNGLSCMACHQHGTIRFKDQVRVSHVLGGTARDKVRSLYKPANEMDKLLELDDERFIRPLESAMGPFLKKGADANKNIRDFPEPVSHIAKWYISQEMTVTEVSRELGLDKPATVQGAVQANPRLQELGLSPLVQNGTIKREVWEFQEFVTSPYQEAARELKLGTPVRVE